MFLLLVVDESIDNLIPDCYLGTYLPTTMLIDQAVGLGLQLLSALKHLHRRSLVHRDVAARNCYLAASHLRLADSALSRDLFPNDYHCLGHNENRPVNYGCNFRTIFRRSGYRRNVEESVNTV